MRIESLHIDRFGKLRDFDLTLEEGLTLIYGRNESGKSTVMAFLRAMLYGLNGNSASIEQNDRRRYMPWGEISMGGSLRLTDGNGTDLIAGKETSVIGVRYENMLFGNYWHGGETVVTDASGAEVNRIAYYTTVPQSETRVWTLTTVAPFSLTSNAVGGELNGSKAQRKLTQGADGAITVSAADGADYAVEADGECSFNRAKLLQNRRIYLKYKYEKDGLIYHATDTLTFRNRVRDGVNEWQDENPANYE